MRVFLHSISSHKMCLSPTDVETTLAGYRYQALNTDEKLCSVVVNNQQWVSIIVSESILKYGKKCYGYYWCVNLSRGASKIYLETAPTLIFYFKISSLTGVNSWLTAATNILTLGCFWLWSSGAAYSTEQNEYASVFVCEISAHSEHVQTWTI